MIVVETKRTRQKVLVICFFILGFAVIGFSIALFDTAATPLALIGNLFFAIGSGFWLKLKGRSLFHIVWPLFFGLIGVAIIYSLKDESKLSEVKENGKSNSNLH